MFVTTSSTCPRNVEVFQSMSEVRPTPPTAHASVLHMTRSLALPYTGRGLTDKTLSASLGISVLPQHNLQERPGPGGHCLRRTVDRVMARRPTVWLGIWWGPPYGSPDTLGQPPLGLQISISVSRSLRPVWARSDGIVSGVSICRPHIGPSGQAVLSKSIETQCSAQSI